MKYIYKLVAAIGALAVAPLMIFGEIFYFKFSSTALSIAFSLGQFLNSEKINEILEQTGGVAPEFVADSMSVFEIVDLIKGTSGTIEIPESAQILVSPFITFAVTAILLAICAVATAVIAIVCKNNRKVIYSSVVGIGLSLVVSECFKAVAEPVLEGKVSLSTIMGSTWADIIGVVQELSLTTFFWFIPAVFAGIILWTVLYNYTLPESEKRERKLMLEEADDQ